MRARKLFKILGTALGLLVILLLLSVAIFVFNPFEGSLADLRFAVPRDVDFFVRKLNLEDDFDEFPEPHFWGELGIHPEWQQIVASPTYRDLNGSGEITRALQDLRDQAEDLNHRTSGQLDLLGDFLGAEVQIAGRLGEGGLPTTWCSYARISWRAKFAWGLLGYTFVQEELRKGGVQVRPEEDLVVITPNGSPDLYAARHLDCLFLGNDRDLVRRSWELASGIGDPDSFGGTANYQDGIEKRIEEWEETTGQMANAVEFFVRPSKLFRMPDVVFDDNWPDPDHPTDMNARVMASFLNLDSWLGLTGAMIIEPGAASLVASIELNQNEHTAFQSNFFKTESQLRRDWLDPFLRMVPARNPSQDGACAAAAMRMPAGDFLREMYSALDDADKSLLNDSLRKTAQYDGTLDLIEKLELAFYPRTGFVFRRNTPDPEIPVAEPAPTPQFAWVFWLRSGGQKIVSDFVELLTRYRGVIGLEQAYNLPLGLAGQGVGGDAAREFTNPHIPGTGSFATPRLPAVLRGQQLRSVHQGHDEHPGGQPAVDLREGRLLLLLPRAAAVGQRLRLHRGGRARVGAAGVRAGHRHPLDGHRPGVGDGQPDECREQGLPQPVLALRIDGGDPAGGARRLRRSGGEGAGVDVAGRGVVVQRRGEGQHPGDHRVHSVVRVGLHADQSGAPLHAPDGEHDRVVSVISAARWQLLKEHPQALSFQPLRSRPRWRNWQTR